MEDVKIVTEKCNFKFRVNGLMCINDKILTVEMCNNGFYCLPGGHVELGENTEAAIIREMKEEVGCDVKIVNTLAIVENFFEGKNNKKFHEIGFYYIVDPVDIKQVNLEDYEVIERDKNEDKKLDFKWISIDKLEKVNFRPTFLKEKLACRNHEFIHHIIQ